MTSIAELDAELGDIQSRISNLQARRANLASILLSTPHLSTRLQSGLTTRRNQRDHAIQVSRQQSRRNLKSTYRACAGVTAYKVQDPDPNAVDNGNVLGVRIEVSVRSKYVETYHVLFNRPSATHETMLRVHHHTIPPCIPVRQLAEKFMPQTRRDVGKTTEQHLIRFGRLLRKELVSWHLRTTAVEQLRIEAGLSDPKARERALPKEPAYGKVLNAFVSDDEEDLDEEDALNRQAGPIRITDIETDMAVRQITITWSHGQTAVFDVSKDGEIVRGVVKSAYGVRSHELGRMGMGRIEGLVRRLS
jgi:central kinetochore subunit Mal2/MCM21